MSPNHRTISKAIAILLVLAMAQVYVQIGLAAPNTTPGQQPPQFIARLSSTKGGPITINGNSASVGASIVTGALIETLDQSATINLGSFGTLEVGPNTQLRLDYDQQGNTRVTLIRGCAILRTRNNAAGEILTEQGSAAQTDGQKKKEADVCFLLGRVTVNQNAAANSILGVSSTTGSTGAGISGGALLAILGAVIGVVIAAVAAASGDEIDTVVEPPVNPSPSSPS
jgi:hypothetical protein